MTQELKVLLGVGCVTVILLVGGVMLLSGKGTTPVVVSDTQALIRSDSNKYGNPKAKVVLVEFGDYQCPACGYNHPQVKKTLETYKDDVFFVFRNLPLPMHANALIAAEAAEAAGKQGKYWQMHDMLYENQQEWSESKDPLSVFVGYAKKVGINADTFKEVVEDQLFADKIAKDVSDADALAVRQTPTFFLNGKKMEGLQTYENLKREIDIILKKK